MRSSTAERAEDIPARDSVFAFGPFVLDSGEQRLTRDGTPLPLPPKAFKVLLVLVSRGGHLVTKDELLATAWPDTVVEEGGLARNVSLLRRTLGDDTGQPRYVETVAKRGYRFIAAVSVGTGRNEAATRNSGPTTQSNSLVVSSTADAGSGATSHPAPAAEPPAASEREAPAPAAARGPRGAFAHTIAAAATAGIILLVAFVWLWNRADWTGSGSGARQPTIAVLPLANLSGDPSQEFFADGLTEAVITEMTKLRGIRVISRTSVMRYRKPERSLSEIARELSADYVVEGAVRRNGDRVLITVQLIDGATDRHVWSRTFDREAVDILELEQSVAADVAGAVSAEPIVAVPTAASSHHVSPDLYDTYLRARQHLTRRTDADLKAAADLFRQVTQDDPQFAPGFSGLAETHVVLCGRGVLALDEARAVIIENARRAIRLDPSLGEPHASLAVVSDEWEAEFRTAIRKQPGFSMAYLRLGEMLAHRGRHGEALAAAETAWALDPLSPVIGTVLGDVRRRAGQVERAEAALRRVMEIDPTFHSGHWVLGLTLLQRNRFAAAAEHLRLAASYSGHNAVVESHFGYALARAGRQQEARAVLAELQNRDKGERLDSRCWLLLPWALGDAERPAQAMARLLTYQYEEAVRIRNDPMYRDFLRDPRVAVRVAVLTGRHPAPAVQTAEP